MIVLVESYITTLSLENIILRLLKSLLITIAKISSSFKGLGKLNFILKELETIGLFFEYFTYVIYIGLNYYTDVNKIRLPVSMT